MGDDDAHAVLPGQSLANMARKIEDLRQVEREATDIAELFDYYIDPIKRILESGFQF